MALDEMILGAIVDGVFSLIFDKSTNTIANWKNEREVKRAFREALKATIEEFEAQQPEWFGGLFDASFFQHEGQPVLAQFLRRDGRPDPSELAALWADSLNINQPERRAYYTRELEAVASTFLDILSHQLKVQPALNELQNNRIHEQLALDLHAIRSHLAAEEATPGTRRDYLRWLIDRNFYIDSRGTFQTQRQVQVKLDDVYVSLRAQREETLNEVDSAHSQYEERAGKEDPPLYWSRPLHVLTAEDIEDQQEQQLHAIKRSLSNKPAEIRELADVVKAHDRLVVLGDPGSGKTTLLRYLAISHAQALLKNQPTAKDLGPAAFPILIRIAEYAEDGNWRKKSLSKFLPEVPMLHECPKNGIGDLFHKELAKGDCLVLLDGLDEIVSADERRGVVGRIEDFVLRYGAKEQENRFVITSRIAGYRIAPLAAPFTHYTVQEMDETQIQRFLERWCRAIEDTQTPDVSPQERQQTAQREIDNIMNAVRANPGVRRLAANPLLLRVLALIQRSGSRLPQKRIELYKLAADTLARTWRPAQGVPESALVKDEYLTPLLSHLAYWLHLNKPTGIATEREVYEVLGEKWADLNDLPWNPDRSNAKIREEVSKFLLQVREHTGLFVERAPRRYGFMHLTFEEYYVARHLVDRSKTRATLIRKHLHDPRWEEPILLALGFVGLDYPLEASELIETAILAEGEDAAALNFKPSQYEQHLGRDYLFALRCLGDNIPLRKNLLKKLLDRFTDELLHSSGLARYRRYRQAIDEKLQHLAGSDSGELVKATLVQSLHDPDTLVRRNAVASLGQFVEQGQEVVPALLEALHDPNSGVRRNAIASLGQFVEQGQEVVPALLEALHDSNTLVRSMAVLSLGQFVEQGQEVVPALLEALRDPDSGVRSNALRSLIRFAEQGQEVVPALLEALRDPDTLVRSMTVRSLAQFAGHEQEVVPAILEALHDPDSDVRSKAVLSLIQLSEHSDKVVPAILKVALYDPDKDVRFTVMRWLGNLSSPTDGVVTVLLAALHDVDASVRSTAANSLGELSTSSEEVVVALLEASHDVDASVRFTAISSLSNTTIKQSEIIAALVPILQDADLALRFAAAQILTKQQYISPETIAVLCEALQQVKVSHIRQDAARSLAKMDLGDDTIQSVLWSGLLDEDYFVRNICVEALVQAGKQMSLVQRQKFEAKVVRALQMKKFAITDNFLLRPAYDSAYDLLWQLVIGEDDEKENTNA